MVPIFWATLQYSSIGMPSSLDITHHLWIGPIHPPNSSNWAIRPSHSPTCVSVRQHRSLPFYLQKYISHTLADEGKPDRNKPANFRPITNLHIPFPRFYNVYCWQEASSI